MREAGNFYYWPLIFNFIRKKVSDRISNSERLAFERTVLANERTYLSYVRSFIVTLSSGLAILKLEFLSNLKFLGIILTIVGPILFITGTIRFFYVKIKLRRFMPERGVRRRPSREA